MKITLAKNENEAYTKQNENRRRADYQKNRKTAAEALRENEDGASREIRSPKNTHNYQIETGKDCSGSFEREKRLCDFEQTEKNGAKEVLSDRMEWKKRGSRKRPPLFTSLYKT
ncbi:hypothetical protein Nepgr_001935 [Nepenthes gracilis]|uniref:Uncharacterized protein n=1 Tax=Nepenthes gracilis TaxID=150966 RepID=A0AAD3RXV8_NEPGR|nr:hypothetical protein Nepgr_001935 [Nepenthes gracilis]